MQIGFTGTQMGMTTFQKEMVETILTIRGTYFASVHQVHHGNCIGADEEFHEIVRKIDPTMPIIVHPPIKQEKESSIAWNSNDTDTNVIILVRKDYLKRNHNIVNASELMIVCPSEEEEQLRSGTWATYRYANKKHKHVFLILPYPNSTEFPIVDRNDKQGHVLS